MQSIHPITVKTCRPLYGKPVLIYLYDGTEIYGVLNRIEKNTLILNDDTQANLNSSTKKTKNIVPKSRAVKNKAIKKQTQPLLPNQVPEEYSPFGFPLLSDAAPGFRGGFHIQLASIAALFSE